MKKPAYQKEEMWNNNECGQAWFSSDLFRSNARCRNHASVYKLENGSRMKSLGSEIISPKLCFVVQVKNKIVSLALLL